MNLRRKTKAISRHSEPPRRAHWLTRAAVAAGMVALVAVVCAASWAPASSASSSKVPKISISSFNLGFTVMPKLKALTAAGTGLVGAILPTTIGSARYTEFDAPYLKRAFQAAGYKSSQYVITNAGGSDATELAMAEADITKGAKVLVMDPQDSTVGNEIQSYAASHGVALISYDRATFQGKNTYYVSFNNFRVGQLIGNGFKSCVSAWGVTNPHVFELDGGENSDPNAISFAQGYNSVIWGTQKTPLSPPMTSSLGYSLVGDQIETDWVPATGQTIFAQQFTAHPDINATVEANDDGANAVIQVLKSKGVKPMTIPTTGQDSTMEGMQNILTGYQCGSVYKPIYLEAQDAVALATILRAGQKPPRALLNAKTVDPANSSITEPASLLTPKWVTASNIESTVIKDKFISASQLCPAVGASVCSQYGIH
jgi:D-xylose transport system substrate-binding protein